MPGALLQKHLMIFVRLSRNHMSTVRSRLTGTIPYHLSYDYGK